MSNEQNKWAEGYKAFRDKHPDCPEAEEVETLNLIMKRQFADAIKSGEKKVDFRPYSKHYCDRLYDKAVTKYIELHDDDETNEAIENQYIEPLKIVKNIHFHNYNDTWHMDCECVANGVISLTADDVKFMQDEYGCHELDEEFAELEKQRAKKRPLLFYFVIGKIKSSDN